MSSPLFRVQRARKASSPMWSGMMRVDPSISTKLHPPGCGPANDAGLPVGLFGAPDRAWTRTAVIGGRQLSHGGWVGGLKFGRGGVAWLSLLR